MRQIHIATAARRNIAKWANETWQWADLVKRCSNTVRTAETVAEYTKMSRDQQSNVKDVGGFVGGYLNEGKRNKNSVKFRDVICLDIDCGKAGIWDKFTEEFKDVESFCYSTHKHTNAVPRLRIVLLLDRSISPEEYEAVSRAVANKVGKDYFDSTTYAPERLMYWPSTSADGEWFFRHQEGAPLCADDMLGTYINWRDASEWGDSFYDEKRRERESKKQGDPTEKPGIVGCFCRTYDIHSVIAEYLSDIYEAAGPDRYTYKQGTVSAGLVVYGDGKFAYSHNATDPCSQHLVNAFDLVRLHFYAERDEGAHPYTPIHKMPSFIAMGKLAEEDTKVRALRLKESVSSATMDFAEVEEDDDMAWAAECELTKGGSFKNTRPNMRIVLDKSPEFRGKLWLNEFSQQICVRGFLPWQKGPERGPFDHEWTNIDDSCLRDYLETKYGLTGTEKIADALVSVANMHSEHPVREYLSGLKWDGKPRLETLFIDFLGAKDSKITRHFTRKHLVAAVARVMVPGTKYDQILTLVGREGIGKSTILRELAGDKWFNDTILSLDGKEGMEALQGAWIIEVAELVGVKKSENEQIKNYLSRQVDRFRPAYGRRQETYKRHCVFFATTNEKGFLKGDTGNRRYWVVETGVEAQTKNVFKDFTGDYRNQVWAEALHFYREGERLTIDPDLLGEAMRLQESYNENSEDERIGIIKEFLDKRLPVDWKTRSIARKQAYFKDTDPLNPDGVVRRDTISNVEIYVECFGQSLSDQKLKYKTREITSLMAHVEGWERGGVVSLGGEYGKQRIYKRIIKENDDDEEL